MEYWIKLICALFNKIELLLNSSIKLLSETGYRVTLSLPIVLQQSFNFSNSFYNCLEEMGLDSKILKEETNSYQLVFKVLKKDFFDVSIIIPFFNQSENTLLTVQSILNNAKAIVEIILIDNGSTETESQIVFESFKNYDVVRIIKNETNEGFPKAVNKGILAAKGNNIIVANNDIIVTEGAIEKMMAFAQMENVGIVGTLTNNGSGFQIDTEANYKNLDEMYEHAKNITKKNYLQYLEYPRIAFIFVLITRKVIDTIGGLDERFSPGNYEDDDFCLRSFLSGFKGIIAFDVFIHHFGSKSFLLDGKEKYEKILEINKGKFVAKWGETSEEIWKTGIVPKTRNLEYAISKNEGSQYLKRTLENALNEEYDLAKENIDKVLEIINKQNLKNIDLIELKDIEKLKQQIYAKI